MKTHQSPVLEAGKTYINTDPNIWPVGMREARITIGRIYPDDGKSLNVAYSFVETSGRTGEGTMRQAHAEKHLVLALSGTV